MPGTTYPGGLGGYRVYQAAGDNASSWVPARGPLTGVAPSGWPN
jgi:hypothetical protein